MAQKIAFFDLDGTFFRWQLYHNLVFELKDRGFFSEEAAARLDESLFDWQARQKTWYDYESDVITAFEPLLKSMDLHLFDEAAQAVVSKSGHKIYNYTKKLLDNLNSQGYFTLAISGSQQEIAESFANMYGFSDCIGVLYERSNGKLTGNVVRRVPGRKHEIIKEFLGSHPEITLEGSIAIGDSGGDISMLEIVDRPIAFNPSEELLAKAKENGWEIIIERKNIAYTLKRGDDGYLLEKTDSL